MITWSTRSSTAFANHSAQVGDLRLQTVGRKPRQARWGGALRAVPRRRTQPNWSHHLLPPASSLSCRALASAARVAVTDHPAFENRRELRHQCVVHDHRQAVDRRLETVGRKPRRGAEAERFLFAERRDVQARPLFPTASSLQPDLWSACHEKLRAPHRRVHRSRPLAPRDRSRVSRPFPADARAPSVEHPADFIEATHRGFVDVERTDARALGESE